MMCKKDFEGKEDTSGLTVSMKKSLCETGEVLVMGSGFCGLEGLISMFEKGVFGSALIKKRR